MAAKKKEAAVQAENLESTPPVSKTKTTKKSEPAVPSVADETPSAPAKATTAVPSKKIQSETVVEPVSVKAEAVVEEPTSKSRKKIPTPAAASDMDSALVRKKPAAPAVDSEIDPVIDPADVEILAVIPEEIVADLGIDDLDIPTPKKEAKPAKKVAEAKVDKKAPTKSSSDMAGGDTKKAPTKPSSTSRQPLPSLPPKPVVPIPRPTATPSVRNNEKKPSIIVAHRKMENKLKPAKEEDSIPVYQPETYRSILDEPVQPLGPVFRYSDEDLSDFREIILGRLEAARKELSFLQGLIRHKDEAGTEDTENRFMHMEDGSGAMEREQLSQLAGRQIQFINHLEKALVRIENKTYGICRVTGKLIDKARLKAVPHATLSIEAKKMMGPGKTTQQ